MYNFGDALPEANSAIVAALGLPGATERDDRDWLHFRVDVVDSKTGTACFSVQYTGRVKWWSVANSTHEVQFVSLGGSVTKRIEYLKVQAAETGQYRATVIVPESCIPTREQLRVFFDRHPENVTVVPPGGLLPLAATTALGVLGVAEPDTDRTRTLSTDDVRVLVKIVFPGPSPQMTVVTYPPDQFATLNRARNDYKGDLVLIVTLQSYGYGIFYTDSVPSEGRTVEGTDFLLVGDRQHDSQGEPKRSKLSATDPGALPGQ